MKFTIDTTTGLLAPAQFIASPNCDARPDSSSDISLLVIHGISLPPGEFGGQGITQCFTNSLNPNEHPYYREIADLKVSSHLLVRRDGSVIQYVPFTERAWHAGKSSFDGRERCNDYSIGVELEGTDEIPYEKAQYTALIALTKALLSAYPYITHDRIVGHSDIAPGRKTDPGESFDWAYYRKQLSGE